MILFYVCLLGLCLGSFVNAFVWRMHEKAELQAKKKIDKVRLEKLSITKGRSMCTHCSHELAVKDLVPVLSWLYLRGKCRYCHKKIQDTPIAELLGAVTFGISYAFWSYDFTSAGITLLALWLFALVFLIALAVYDARWYILPTKLILPLGLISATYAGIVLFQDEFKVSKLISLALAVLLLWGLFRVLYAASKGTWIGFGDVRLAIPLALFVGSPVKVVILLFTASLLGTILSLPQLIRGQKNSKSQLPFGPYLILGCFVAVIFGSSILTWLDNALFAL